MAVCSSWSFNCSNCPDIKTLNQEPGIPELEQLYYDKYDYDSIGFPFLAEISREMIKKLSVKFPKKNIIIKPHPKENIKDWEKKLNIKKKKRSRQAHQVHKRVN